MDDEVAPWKRVTSIKTLELSIKQICIVLSDRVYIPTDKLPSKVINGILRIAAFKNPEFYKAQAMRMSTYDKSRVLHLGELLEKHIVLPRACIEDVCAFFEELSVEVTIQDETFAGRAIDVSFNGDLTSLQHKAGLTMLAHNNGVLSATTAFGKTVLAAWMIASRKVNTLILVHRQQLLEQWKERLTQFLNVNEQLPTTPKGRGYRKPKSIFGEIGSGKFKKYGIIDVALVQSLLKNDEVNPCMKEYGMVIVDECHHISALSFEKVIKSTNARYVYGLSATPVRQDGHHPIIFMQCGPIRFSVDAKSQAKEHTYSRIVQPMFTSFKMPPRTDDSKWSIQEIYSAITTYEPRNHMIIKDVVDAVSKGNCPIVLVDRKSHVELLTTRLQEHGLFALSMTGGARAKERKAIQENINDAQVIVATGKLIGEGFDHARLDTLFLASPVAWKGTVEQYVGRLHRLHEDKTEVRVIDYVDIHEPVLERMYSKRLKTYLDTGYSAKTMNANGIETGILYDHNNFESIYYSDFNGAFDTIHIVSPFITVKRVMSVLEKLNSVIHKGVKISVLTRPATDYEEKNQKNIMNALALLKNNNISVLTRTGMHQKYTIIDRSIVWYGSINVLSYGKSEESIMRLQNRELANELLTINT